VREKYYCGWLILAESASRTRQKIPSPLHLLAVVGAEGVRSGAASPPVEDRGMAGTAASVERVRDRATGLDKFVLREARGSSVEVYLYGGQVTFWKNNFGHQLLFVSNKATFKPPKAIRGGIQICFPQVWSSSCFSHVSFGSGCLLKPR